MYLSISIDQLLLRIKPDITQYQYMMFWYQQMSAFLEIKKRLIDINIYHLDLLISMSYLLI